MKKSVEQDHWLVDLVDSWIESAVIDGADGRLGLWFAYAGGEIAGYARSRDMDPAPVSRLAHGSPSYKNGEPTKALRDAVRFCELLLDGEVGSPWKPADAEPPAGWHGPLPGTQESLAKILLRSEAKAGARRTLKAHLRRNGHLWGRQLNRTTFELWFDNARKYEDAAERHRAT